MDFILSLDKSLLHLINIDWTHPWLSAIFPVLTDLNRQPWFGYVVAPLMLALCWRKFGKKGLLIFFGMVLTLGLTDLVGNQVFKKNVQRLRPADAWGDQVIVRSPYGGYSFVSNHASNMFGFATYTSAFFPQAAVPLYGLAAVIGYSRVYNGVHYPTDVLGGGLLGYFLGKMTALLCQFTLVRISRKKQKT